MNELYVVDEICVPRELSMYLKRAYGTSVIEPIVLIAKSWGFEFKSWKFSVFS